VKVLSSYCGSGRSKPAVIPLVSARLLADYYPNNHYTSKAQVLSISITPRRIERTQSRSYSERLYLPSDQTTHHCAPRLRPLYGPIIPRKSLDHSFPSISPSPTAYPMYEFDEDILPRPQPSVPQKHCFSSDRKIPTLQTNPPFYYPNKADHHRLHQTRSINVQHLITHHSMRKRCVRV
jgi:hypothetical protein